MTHLLTNKKQQSIALFFVFMALIVFKSALPDGLVLFPDDWILPIQMWLNDVLYFIQDDFLLIETFNVEDDIEEEITATMILTRGIADVIQFCIDVIRNILLGGTKGLALPALPWTAVAAIAFILGYALRGYKLAMLAGLTVVYLAFFGQWTESMQTLSLVLVAAPIALVFGLTLGILSHKYLTIERILAPFLNIAQSLPHFSYLIPVVVFYGIGDHAGAIATVIFATPPMIRLTTLGLKKVPEEILESGKMSGCNQWQLLTRVQIPSARHDIMIGVNQVIMQCLAMVVIASFIGASGLGYNLLVVLNSLKIGKALELGVSIVLIAIVLDQLSLAWANKQPDYRANLPFVIRYKFPLLIVLAIVVSILLSQLFPIFYAVPESAILSTAVFWDGIVDWIVTNWFTALQSFRNFFLIDILIPMRNAYVGTPMIAVFALIMGAGFILGGIKSAFITGAFFLFIAVTGWWEKAMITLYMVSFSVFVSMLIGVTVGIWASRKDGRTKFMLLICDTFQTFPSFVYLIPVIMLFQVNDVSVIAAVVIYATIPATRYTIEGMRNVPQGLQDVATMSGVNAVQRLMKIELPMAFPHIMIGINQTVLFSLFMVILGAFIGTQDLGQEIMQALSESNMGKGLVLGLCVAFMGLAVDHLITQWATKRKQELGLI